jgi:hypothetical protein
MNKSTGCPVSNALSQRHYNCRSIFIDACVLQLLLIGSGGAGMYVCRFSIIGKRPRYVTAGREVGAELLACLVVRQCTNWRWANAGLWVRKKLFRRDCILQTPAAVTGPDR